MTEPTISQALARFADQVNFDRLPPDVVDSVKQRVLDTVGICLASHSFGLGDGVAEMVDAWSGAPAASIIGRCDRYPAPEAALVNGTLAHSLDFDDTHLPSVLHPSASIVPAVLAMSQTVRASGTDAIAALAVGIEITVRTGMGGYLPEAGNLFFERGWHATSICGTLGAAAAGAKLLGLGEDGVAHALGIAASMGAGVIEANRAGGTVKRLHCGWAAHAGLIAAELVSRGFTGPPTVFEGRFGFFRAFLDGQCSTDAILGGLGERWEVPGIFFKPYPANHYTHAAIDAALAIRRTLGPSFDVAGVARIELGAAAAALRTIAEPRVEKVRPRSGYHAQFSGPFTIAAALLGGSGLGVGFDDFTDAKAADPTILGLAAKVETFADPACDELFPREFPAVVRLVLDNGRVLEERVMHNRGGPSNPLSAAELRQKFTTNAGRTLPPRQCDELAAAIFSLETADSLDPLLALTAPKADGAD